MGGDRKYDADFHAWTHEQATLLRSGRLSEIDAEHIAEKIETLGRGERRELVNLLSVLLLLQPTARALPSPNPMAPTS